MRLFGSEMASYASVGAIAVGVALALPVDGFRFRARPMPGGGPVCAYVTLDSQTEAALLKKAKDTWRRGGGSHVYADLVFADLPAEEHKSVLPESPRPRDSSVSVVERGRTPYLPSRGAKPPRRILPMEQTDELTFSRDELLKID